jgi:hypothetical protein
MYLVLQCSIEMFTFRVVNICRYILKNPKVNMQSDATDLFNQTLLNHIRPNLTKFQ